MRNSDEKNDRVRVPDITASLHKINSLHFVQAILLIKQITAFDTAQLQIRRLHPRSHLLNQMLFECPHLHRHHLLQH